ncbi:argonaute-like protein [Paraphysoderma sedebokerense]|nr:argonaute-like protein [Paraphysoderma sedebokerense]
MLIGLSIYSGQFRAVQESEINAIRKACHRLHPSYNPKITFVVVQKRHHTRFYGINQQDMDKSGNLKSGLVVDSVVTHPTQFCFYLQSQRGIVGTCKPAYYHVLCDENNFTPDSLQRLTFNLCHILQRATKAVSYCTPAYYAHIVAFRAKSYVDASTATKASETGIIEIHPNLEGRMWFL